MYFKENVFSSFLSQTHATSWSGPDFIFSHVKVEKTAKAMETRTQRTDCGPRGGRRGWDEPREQHGNIHITLPYVIARGEFAVWLRELKPCSL